MAEGNTAVHAARSLFLQFFFVRQTAGFDFFPVFDALLRRNDLDKFFDVTVPVYQNPAGNTAAGIFCVFQDHFLQLHGIIDFLQLFQQYDFFVTVARKGTVFI